MVRINGRIPSMVFPFGLIIIFCSTFIVEVQALSIDFSDQDQGSLAQLPKLHGGSGYNISEKNDSGFPGATNQKFSNSENPLDIAGSGSQMKFVIGESNSTHTWIPDPTNQTDGYYIPNDAGYIELNSSRGQSYQHFFNITSGSYTYNSGTLVNKTGIVDGTDWVTAEEYPLRFIVRLTDGSILSSDNLTQITNYFSTLDNSTIWGVGIEGFTGVMAFYLNFQDLDWGHGQYIYYPRMLNGQITSFNQPLYAIYPHLYVRYNDIIYDQLVNDRSLYAGVTDPRNNLNFEIVDDTLILEFHTYGLTILGSTWDFVHGFKYNTTEQLFHQITEFRCRDRDFQDVGMAYEITSSPQAVGTSYQPDRFRISNETELVEVTISEAWEAGTYLEDFYSQIQIISQNNESFTFSFADMELAGFTQKYLNLHDQFFPDGSNRLTLRAGMYGYGSYLQGTIIEIDPTFSAKQTTGGYDGSVYFNGATYNPSIGGNRMFVSYAGANSYRSTLGFDTAITSNIVSSSLAQFSFHTETSATESNEYLGLGLYDKGDTDEIWSETELDADEQGMYDQSMYYSSSTFYNDPASNTNYTVSDATFGAFIDQWVTHHNVDPSGSQFVAIKLFAGTGCDSGTTDNINIFAAEETTASKRPSLLFTYTVNDPPAVPTLNTDSGNTYGGYTHTIKTDHTDPDGDTDIDLMYIQYYYSGYNITLSSPQATSSGSTTVITGSGYLVGTPTYSHTTDPTDGYRVTWTITLDWDFVDDTAYTVYGRTLDDLGNRCAWTSLDTNNLFENDLIVYSMSFTLSDSAYSEDGNTALTNDEWFRGGVDITASGTITYEGTTNVYPDTSEGIHVDFYADGSQRTEDTTLGASGAFSAPAYTTVSTTGLDSVFALDCQMNNIPSGGSESSTGAASAINSKRDNENPTITSFNHADSNSGDGEDPQNGYDDDTTAVYTVVGGSDGSGSGLHATETYRYEWMDAGYGSWTTSSSYSASVVDDQSGDSDGQIKDKVGNIYTFDGEDIVIDTDNPACSITEGRLTGYVDGYHAYHTGGSLYVNTGANDYMSITINNDGMSNSGFRKIVWDVGSQFETSETDYGGLPDSKDFYYLSDTPSGNWVIYLYNNAGNVQILVWWAITVDTSNPSGGISYDTENSIYLDDLGVVVDSGYYSDNMPTAQDYIVGGTASDASSGIASVIDDSTFGDNPSAVGTTSWSFTYSIDSSDAGVYDDETITYTIYDNVGNSITDEYIFYNDDWNPVPVLDEETEASIYLYAEYGSSAQGLYGSGMGSVQSFTVGGYASDTGSTFGDSGNTVDNSSFGDDPPNSGTANAWEFIYTIDSADNGDVTITITTTDDVGNTGTVIYYFFEDNTNPVISVTGESESSIYLYDAYGTSVQGLYGSGMGASLQNFIVSGSSSDTNGISTITDDSIFGDDPSAVGTTSWSFTYEIDSSDDGSQTITYTATDNVGNTDTDFYYFFEDNTNPVSTVSLGTESSAYLHYENITSGFYSDLMGGSLQTFTITGTSSDANGISTLTDDSSFGDDPSNTGSVTAWSFAYEIDSTDSGDEVITYTATDNVGNTGTDSFTFYEDTTAPTFSSFTLNQIGSRKEDNWYPNTAPQTTVVSPSDPSSGLPSSYVDYRFNSGLWVGYSSTLVYTWSLTANINNTLEMRLIDNVGNVNDENEEWVWVDTVLPVLGWLILNETYAPNWFDQSVSNTAQATISWTEINVYSVESGCALSHTDDSSPTGGVSYINHTITGAEDGSYAVSITIYDKAGNSDTTLLGSEAPIRLESGMSVDSHLVEYWFLYYRSDGRSLDWKEFNTTYVLDEDYSNYTEVLLLGVGVGKLRLNDTSSLRIITRDYFQEVIYNQSFSLPSSGVKNIQLDVQTFKVASNFDGVVNITIERTSGSGSFDEQIMPYEIFRWDLYSTTYNITGLVHVTGSYAKDDEGNTLNDFQVNLTINDVAIFIEVVSSDLASFTFVDQNGKFMQAKQFKIYVEGSRIYSDSFTWSDITTTKNITVTDLFGNQIYQSLTASYSRFLDLELALFSVKIINMDSTPVYVNISLGSLEYSEWLFAYEIVEYKLKNATSYDITFFYSTIAVGYSVSLNGTTYADSFTIITDTLFVITEDDILQIDVSVAQPEPADPNIEVIVNNTAIQDDIDEINQRFNDTDRKIDVFGSALAVLIFLGFTTLALALLQPDRYKALKKRLEKEGINLVDYGKGKKDEILKDW